MKALEYFRQVQKAEQRMKTLQARLRHFEDLGLVITTKPSGIPGAHQGGSSRVELAAVGMVDSMRSLTDQVAGYAALIAEAEQVIARVPKERFRKILTLKYLCGWSLRSISDELRYKDSNSVYRAHGFALAAAQSVLDRLPGKQ